MESRIREGQSKLFDVFVLLIRGENDNPIASCYPENGLNEDLRRNVAKFAFPFHENFESSNIDYFTFVLTDIDGKFKFGFCRMSAGSKSTLCLISSYPWFEIFYKVLNHLADTQNSMHGSVEDLLAQLWVIDPSAPGKRPLSYKVLGNQFTIQYPNPDKLPSIPESRNLTEYYNAIDGHNMLIIFASMLFERRIIVTSRKLSRLTACVYGATSLIYPLNWQHIFIPVLPCHLIDYISAPMPYLIGVHSSVFEMAKSIEIDDAVIVDADARKVTFSHGDLTALPISIVTSLKKDLNLHRSDNHCSLTGDKLSHAFLKAMVSLIGGYRTALVLEGGKIGFDSDIFLHSHPSNMQMFLRTILQSQSFEQFIADRLSLSRYIKGFSDVFEDAVLNAEAKNKQSKGGSVKNKMNLIIQEKVLVDIRKKVKSTSVKTLSSVKKKLEFKKSEDQTSGKNTMAKKDVTVQSSTLAHGSNVHSAGVNLGDTSGNLRMTPSDLRRQQSTSRPSTIKNRDTHLVVDDSCDMLGALRQRSSSDFMTELDRTSLFKKYSFDDLEISNPALEHDAVNLSSVCLESYHNSIGSKSEQTSTDLHHMNNSTLIMDSMQNQNVNDSVKVHVNGINSDTHAIVEEESEDDPSDKDSMLEISLINKPETVIRNPDPLLTFPSVQQIRRTLQASNPVKRKVIISVQELPSVKQMVQKLEATSKPQKTKASHFEMGTSYVAQQAAMYSFDRKERISLTRKHAIRAPGQKVKPSGDEDREIGVPQMSEKRSSLITAKSERYQELIDSVKKERNYIFPALPVDPQPDSFGCLLRVSTRSASMRQFDMVQRQFSSMERTSLTLDHSKNELQSSQTAIYDLETETVTKEITSKSLTALYVPDENVLPLKADSNDLSFDLPKSEVIVKLPLNNEAADYLFMSRSCFATSGNRDVLYVPCEFDSTDEPVVDCESSVPSQNQVSMCFPLDAYPAECPVSFPFKLTDNRSCEDLRNQSALCHQKEENGHSETEIVLDDNVCGSSNSSADELEYEFVSKDDTSVCTSQLVPVYESAKDTKYEYGHDCLLESVTVNEVLGRSTNTELLGISHQLQSVGQTEESFDLLFENWFTSSIHETSESLDDNS